MNIWMATTVSVTTCVTQLPDKTVETNLVTVLVMETAQTDVETKLPNGARAEDYSIYRPVSPDAPISLPYYGSLISPDGLV